LANAITVIRRSNDVIVTSLETLSRTTSRKNKTTPKKTKFHQKNRSLLVHIVELSTAVDTNY